MRSEQAEVTSSTAVRRRAVSAVLGSALVVLVLLVPLAWGSPASGAASPRHQTRASWRQDVGRLPTPPVGCYRAAYPKVEWRSTTCKKAPDWPMAPGRSVHAGPVRPSVVGNKTDYSARVSGTISQATGSFADVSSQITETGQVDGVGPQVPNAFTLQLNSQFFTTPACAGSRKPSQCQGWQQFVYDTHTNTVFMQYWLINYARSACPAGWLAYAQSCHANSPAASPSGGALTAAQLATTKLQGRAANGGVDEVSLTTGAGDVALAVNPDTKLNLANAWNTVEWGVYGDGNGGQANFGPGTTLEARTSIVGTSPAAPVCTYEGFTAETNNLNLTTTPSLGVQPTPSIATRQTTGTSRRPTCSAAAGTPADGLADLTNDRAGYCAITASRGVRCWGEGRSGLLGDGKTYTTDSPGSAVPVQVAGVGGVGSLTGVNSLSSGGYGYCALLDDGGVDCWGYGRDGELGNGTFYTTAGNNGSVTPVQVAGVGGAGRLTGVSSLASDGSGYCAVLDSGGVVCWGSGQYGVLGNGQFFPTLDSGSAVPVQVKGVGGTGVLSGVSSVTSAGPSQSGSNYCAVLDSGGVDCWGYGLNGELGNGKYYDSGHYGSAVPVRVKGVGGSGALTGVSNLVGGGPSGNGNNYCALLISGKADCWGYGGSGELGNGQSGYYSYSSAVPVQVEGVGGVGVLADISKLTTDGYGYCGLLNTATVACWGNGASGQLGNGQFYNTPDYGPAYPVQVQAVRGNGALTGVASMGSSNGSYCAVLNSGGVDCWGGRTSGILGDGRFDAASAVPIRVIGVGGRGILGAVSGVTGTGPDYNGANYCALLNDGGVDCWGYGGHGELGDGNYYLTGNYGSAVPVRVLSR